MHEFAVYELTGDCVYAEALKLLIATNPVARLDSNSKEFTLANTVSLSSAVEEALRSALASKGLPPIKDRDIVRWTVREHDYLGIQVFGRAIRSVEVTVRRPVRREEATQDE